MDAAVKLAETQFSWFGASGTVEAFRDSKMGTMEPKRPNKHEIRTKETRDLLLRAAKDVFVRDGYADAELGEIASLAGRTKGAIYAQFKSKEDIFMALVEENALHRRNQMVQALAGSTSVTQNHEMFRKYILNRAKDREWNLLMLEFRLFAVRNPEAKKRFQRFMGGLISPSDESRLRKVLGRPDPKNKKTLDRALGVQILQPLLSALALESEFDAETMDDEALRKIVLQLFDALLPPPSVT